VSIVGVVDVMFFDLDETLIERQVGFDAWASAFLRSLGRYSQDEALWLHSKDEDGLNPRPVLFAAIRERYGLSDGVDVLVERFRGELFTFIPKPTDSTIKALRLAGEAGFRTCIVTNGGAGFQMPKLTGSGLLDLVDGCCILGDVGVSKPDPEVLRIAARRCGAEVTSGSWMIGDRAETDILCAYQAGIQSAWITGGRAWDEVLSYRPTLAVKNVLSAVERITG